MQWLVGIPSRFFKTLASCLAGGGMLLGTWMVSIVMPLSISRFEHFDQPFCRKSRQVAPLGLQSPLAKCSLVPIMRTLEKSSLITLLIVLLGILATTVGVCQEPIAQDSPRITPLVRVIQQIEPAVVGLFTPIGNNQISSGSGTIIHSAGYVLTNNHVLPEPQGFALFSDSKKARFEVVSRYPEFDLAIVKLIDVNTPLPTIRLGRSSEVINGEPIVVAGNPGGRGLVFTAGIVSAKEVLEGGPNAIVMSNYVNDRREKLIQFDAASNKGNSGGPLVNMDGEIIGIVSAVIEGEQNIGFAIPIDRAVRIAQRMIEPEWTHAKNTRIDLEPDSKQAIVRSVSAPKNDPGSSLSSSSIQPGDKIRAIFDDPVRSSFDWILLLETHLPKNDSLKLTIEREGKTLQVDWPLEPVEGIDSVQAETTNNGIRYEFYEGRFNEMPDFDKLEPVRGGISENLDVSAMAMGRNDRFAIRFFGHATVENDGLYRIVVVSDDGSKLYIHDELFIDNDGNHPAKPSGRIVRLKKGLLPIRVEYFQGDGLKSLFVIIEPCPDRRMINLKDMKFLQGERLKVIP
jgi:S1-C subfamily serine protease